MRFSASLVLQTDRLLVIVRVKVKVRQDEVRVRYNYGDIEDVECPCRYYQGIRVVFK